jgi:hypothetical protein
MMWLLLLLAATLATAPSRCIADWSMGQRLAAEAGAALGVPPAILAQPRGGASTAEWRRAGLRLDRSLHGHGFHRTLKYQLKRTHRRELLKLVSGPPRGCAVSLLQPLPSLVFADPYQLQQIVARGGQRGTHFSFQLYGPVDLEL